MILVDSNVLIDVIQDDPVWADWSLRQLQLARAKQKLAINAVILAELAVNYRSPGELKQRLDAVGVVTKAVPDEAAFLAGQTFLMYRRGRGVTSGVLPDFFIGAHAQVAGYTLLTRDVARYKTYFPAVTLIHP
ncbi:MAG: PIN domain-containing protein [Betaproteobacteria bacterium]|nr:MAG: PIN domain-containing protein [Betaproteobacteria bacterium]